jgi:predicted metal-dependent HD superfamily phosphohydrolase
MQLITEILNPYKSQLGKYSLPYFNHATRVYEYSLILLLQKDSKKLAVAAAFHDLDVFLSNTMDYLEQSAKLATNFIVDNKLDLLSDEVAFIITHHHKLTKIKGNVEAEAFRKADLIDLAAGIIRFNLPRSIIRETESRLPRLGFSGTITKRLFKYGITHPLSPLPMVKL